MKRKVLTVKVSRGSTRSLSIGREASPSIETVESLSIGRVASPSIGRVGAPLRESRSSHVSSRLSSRSDSLLAIHTLELITSLSHGINEFS